MSEEALALREKRNKEIRKMYERLNKLQKYSQAEIYYKLSQRFYLLERQIYSIIHQK